MSVRGVENSEPKKKKFTRERTHKNERLENKRKQEKGSEEREHGRRKRVEGRRMDWRKKKL